MGPIFYFSPASGTSTIHLYQVRSISKFTCQYRVSRHPSDLPIKDNTARPRKTTQLHPNMGGRTRHMGGRTRDAANVLDLQHTPSLAFLIWIAPPPRDTTYTYSTNRSHDSRSSHLCKVALGLPFLFEAAAAQQQQGESREITSAVEPSWTLSADPGRELLHAALVDESASPPNHSVRTSSDSCATERFLRISSNVRTASPLQPGRSERGKLILADRLEIGLI